MIIIYILGSIILLIYGRYFIPLRFNQNGFKYVYVENDGTVRELDDEDKAYLSETFHPNDGARPYIKSRYRQKTPDGKLNGFIQRNRVPFYYKIKS